MNREATDLAGVRHIAYETLGSTNAEALVRARAGERGPLWITAARQGTGRGRPGKDWVSPVGSLYSSLLLTDPARPGLAAPDRSAWLRRAAGLGHDIRVRLPEREFSEIFDGLDEAGCFWCAARMASPPSLPAKYSGLAMDDIGTATHSVRSRESGNPESRTQAPFWVPAFAGTNDDGF